LYRIKYIFIYLSVASRRTAKNVFGALLFNISKYNNCIDDYLIYRVSQEERTKLREGVSYVKLCRYNSKHLYPKLNGYGDNGQRKVWASCISA